jgi:5'-3' exonuclease
MIVLVDADSLVWSSCYRQKEHPDDDGLNTLEEAKSKFDEVYMQIINRIEETYEIDRVITFSNSIGNFRKEISNTYKANRVKRDIPEILSELHNYVTFAYDGKQGKGVETDDLVARYWKALTEVEGRDNVIIVSIDKDYKQLPCLIYNYHSKHQCYYKISEEEARRNFYTQMIVGDNADNVNFCKGYGESYCKKVFKDCVSDYSHIRVVFELYKKLYKGKARERFIQCHRLLKLKTD